MAPDDVPAILDALRRAAGGELERLYRPREVERYTYPAPAEALSREVEAAIERRSRSRPSRAPKSRRRPQGRDGA